MREREEKQHFTPFANKYLSPSFSCLHIIHWTEHTLSHLFSLLVFFPYILPPPLPWRNPNYSSKKKKGAPCTLVQVVHCTREPRFSDKWSLKSSAHSSRAVPVEERYCRSLKGRAKGRLFLIRTKVLSKIVGFCFEGLKY